jgi:DNA-binding MarR family transcriptional regulator
MPTESVRNIFAENPRQQYRLIHDIYVQLQDGDSRLLRQFDLTGSQYAVLLHLDDSQGQRLIRISERLLLARSTITRIVDQLQHKGLVERIADHDDRRAQRVLLTPAGHKRREAARAAHDQSLQHRLQMLNSDEHEQLHSLLMKVSKGLDSHLRANGFES